MLKHTSIALVLIATVFLFQNCGSPQASKTQSQNSSDNESSSSGSNVFTAGSDISIYQEGYPLSEAAAQTLAQFLHLRLTGVRAAPDDQTLSLMIKALRNGEKNKAAEIATNSATFIDITVRDFASIMSTREGITVTPLNDFISTIMGTVRDNRPATQLLNGNQIYVLASGMNDTAILSGVLTTNSHYESNDGALAPISNKLVSIRQSMSHNAGTTRMDHDDPAGLLTTRNFMQTHAFQGTNRRVVEYTFKVFLCTPIDAWASTTNPDSHVGRDIGREPVEEYNNKCKGCHTGMDALRPAAAYYDFIETNPDTKAGYVEYRKQHSTNNDHTTTSGAVSTLVTPKFRRGSEIFPGGYVVKDNRWVNYADDNLFGWNGTSSGTGMKDLGVMIANSEGFARCMAKRVFKTVCGEDIESSNTGLVDKLANQFKKGNYNLRTLFVQSALRPECGGGI